jgi:hypothetical protein
MAASIGKDYCIASTWVVWGLGKGGSEHACDECGAKMFVRYSSGLCPQCFNGLRSARHAAGPVVQVPFERALAGVLDDPAIEDALSE